MEYTLHDLSVQVGGTVIGNADCIINSVATLANAEQGAISFLTSTTYRKQLKQTRASAVILREQDAADCPTNALVVDDPHASYAKIASLLYPVAEFAPGIHASAVVDKGAIVDKTTHVGANCYIENGVRLGKNVYIGPGCVLASNVTIGDNSILLANVTVCDETVIGQKALIHPGVVIGSDGFGQANDKGVWLKIPQIGRVVIGDDVEIGANTTIDRGAIEDTVIEDNVKLDNQIQIAHNVRIGAHSVMSGCSAVAGSTKIGRYCAIGGAVGIVGHLDIADNVQITAMSLVTKSIKEPGLYSSGTPLEPNQQWHKNSVRFKQLDDMARRLRALEKKLKDKA